MGTEQRERENVLDTLVNISGAFVSPVAIEITIWSRIPHNNNNKILFQAIAHTKKYTNEEFGHKTR